jgi:hypothetical protein
VQVNSRPGRRLQRSLLLATLLFPLAAWSDPLTLLAQSAPRPATDVKFAQIRADEMKEWLTYLASDNLQGRQVFTEGYGLAAQYVAERLKSWDVKPLGGENSYLQAVRVKGYKSTRNSTITVEANGQTRTFKHNDHVTFAANAGGRQTLTFDSVEFVGYRPDDAGTRNLNKQLVVSIPNLAPPAPGGPGAPGAPPAAAAPAASTTPPPTPAATIRYASPPAPPTAAEEALTQAQAALAQATAAVAEAQRGLRGGGAGGRGAGGRGGAAAPAGRGAQAPQTPDFTTVQRVDALIAPQIMADDTFFEALFAGSGTSFADVKARAQKGEPLTAATLKAKVTIAIDHTYEVVSQQVTHNVVGVIEGSDRRLKETFVVIGAHLDHVGYSQTGASRDRGTDGCRRRSPTAQAAVVAAGKTVQRPTPARGGGGGGGGAQPGRGPQTPAAPAVPFDQRDMISNGADDDGSGSTSLLAIAKAFATGPKPKRSVVVIWHAGEENGLYGSRFNADFPAMPLDRVQTVLNLDMVGRDDCDNIEGDFSNTLFVVGADRISTDLHNLIVETNRTIPSPLTLDYELNDPLDPESVYTRSDHYSYAAKGIPVAFFTTGLHPDYHRPSDGVDKIRFDKMARVAQLVYQAGFAVAQSDATLIRDNKGPRTGFGTAPAILK